MLKIKQCQACQVTVCLRIVIDLSCSREEIWQGALQDLKEAVQILGETYHSVKLLHVTLRLLQGCLTCGAGKEFPLLSDFVSLYHNTFWEMCRRIQNLCEITICNRIPAGVWSVNITHHEGYVFQVLYSVLLA